jgi:hypothetical protein
MCHYGAIQYAHIHTRAQTRMNTHTHTRGRLLSAPARAHGRDANICCHRSLVSTIVHTRARALSHTHRTARTGKRRKRTRGCGHCSIGNLWIKSVVNESRRALLPRGACARPLLEKLGGGGATERREVSEVLEHSARECLRESRKI